MFKYRKKLYNDYIDKSGRVSEKRGDCVLKRMRIEGKQILMAAAFVFTAFMRCGMDAQAASADELIQQQTVSEGVIKNDALPDASTGNDSVSGNSTLGTIPNMNITDDIQAAENTEGNNGIKEAEKANDAEPDKTAKENVLTTVQTVNNDQLQTLNYKDSILTDWQQISDALRTLSVDSLVNSDTDSKSLVLQLQNVKDIPAGIKDSLVSDESGYVKYLHCNIGYGASLVFSGAFDNSGFKGISNAAVTVDSEKRGKKSMAVTVRFAEHEDMGAMASLHVNLPQCAKGTKVSVYAETVSVDADGNVTVGENTCIGNTKADENGNVEVLIQSTANYMFVYKAAKE